MKLPRLQLKIDAFYAGPAIGVAKYRGTSDGKATLDCYEKSQLTSGKYSGWFLAGQAVVDARKLTNLLQSGRVREVPPPA